MAVSWEIGWLLLADSGFLEDLQAKDTLESPKNDRAVTEGMTARFPSS